MKASFTAERKNYSCSAVKLTSTLSTLSLSETPSYNDEEQLGAINQQVETIHDEIDENDSQECEGDAYQSTWLTRQCENFWTEEMELLLTLRLANPVYDPDDEEFTLPMALPEIIC